MARAMWKGSIRFSLVTVPVEAYPALESGDGEIHLHQLHDQCHSRIRYQKTCPIHGEVPNDQIVTGYEYEKGHYVIVDRREVQQAQADGHAIVVDTFIDPEMIDPMFYDGRSYYLFPESAAAEKPYAVLAQAMEKMHRHAVATIVLHGKEQLLILRPIDGVLTMVMLRYQSQVRQPSSVKEHMPERTSTAQELKLAQQLIESTTSDKFNFSKYEDRYTDQLKELIEAKIAGQEVISPPQTEEEVPIINLMDALRQSVKKTKPSGKAKQARKALASRLAAAGSSRRRHRKTS